MHNHILFSNEYNIFIIAFSFVSLDEYSSLITKGSFPYTSKQQEVPVSFVQLSLKTIYKNFNLIVFLLTIILKSVHL